LLKSGLTVTATCTDCHTAHKELPHTNPDLASTVIISLIRAGHVIMELRSSLKIAFTPLSFLIQIKNYLFVSTATAHTKLKSRYRRIQA